MPQENPPANEIVKHLEGLNFPADKNKLVNKARQENAPNNVVQAIQRLPEKTYNSPVDVEKAYGQLR